MMLRRYHPKPDPKSGTAEDAPQADKPAGRSRTRKAPKGDA